MWMGLVSGARAGLANGVSVSSPFGLSGLSRLFGWSCLFSWFGSTNERNQTNQLTRETRQTR